MEYSLQIRGVNADQHEREGKPTENRELTPELRPIVFLQRIIEIVVPVIKPNIEPHCNQVERDDGGEESNRRPFLIRFPIWPGKAPCLAQEAPLRRCSHPQTPS